MFNRINTTDRELEIEWQQIQRRSLNIDKAYEKLYGKKLPLYVTEEDEDATMHSTSKRNS